MNVMKFDEKRPFADVLTVRQAVARARSEGLPVAECAVRRWIKTGALPVRWAGTKALLYYPGLVAFLQGESQPGPPVIALRR